MALEFKEAEAIKFGDIVAIPEMDSELKLRISQLKFNESNSTTEAMSLMSKAFGDKSFEIHEFMVKNMGVNQLQKLQAYLVGGDDGLKAYERQLERITDKLVDDALGGKNA